MVSGGTGSDRNRTRSGIGSWIEEPQTPERFFRWSGRSFGLRFGFTISISTPSYILLFIDTRLQLPLQIHRFPFANDQQRQWRSFLNNFRLQDRIRNHRRSPLVHNPNFLLHSRRRKNPVHSTSRSAFVEWRRIVHFRLKIQGSSYRDRGESSFDGCDEAQEGFASRATRGEEAMAEENGFNQTS